MNVFDLPGPQFLGLYLPFAAIVGILIYLALTQPWRSDEVGLSLLADPYQIAYLRGGNAEMVRLAVVSLADRGQLQLPKVGIIEPVGGAMPRGLRPIEAAILTDCPRPTGRANRVFRMPRVRDACREVSECLVEMGLSPTPREKSTRAIIALAAGVVVVGVGLTKLIIALDRGRENVGFLLMIMLVATIFFGCLALPTLRTPAGRRMLADLKQLMAARRDAPRPGSSPGEALLLAAVYGATGLTGFTDMQALYARAGWNNNSGSGSCGSGSSCGGGDGGSGGGCGGCGSS